MAEPRLCIKCKAVTLHIANRCKDCVTIYNGYVVMNWIAAKKREEELKKVRKGYLS